MRRIGRQRRILAEERQAVTQPVFPVVLVMRQSCALTLGNPQFLLRVVSPWMALFFVVALARSVWFSGERYTDDDLFGEWLVVEAALLAVTAAITTAIAIPWHAVIHRGTPISVVPTVYIRYALRAYAFLASLFAIPTVTFATVYVLTFDGLLSWLAYAGAFAVWGIVVVRLAISLPPLAISAGATTLRFAWTITRGNSHRLFAGAVIMILPIILVPPLATRALFALGVLSSPLRIAIVDAALVSISWAALSALTATYLSLAQRFFTSGQERSLNILRDEFS